ncbi:hypothetical protein [Allonocardiopsis opalescens]|nr:hypothetical protein [Allonocardiopsis opalescens]
MVRKMTPAQLRAALQKAQRKQKQAISNYNREARKYNAAVKKAVDDYNREVRNYNSKARAHNRQIESQRHRLDQEIRRLNSRPTGSTFTNVRTSTQSFVRTYNSVDASLATQSLSPTEEHLLNLVSDEAANSVYLVNALDGDGSPQDDLSEADLRAPSMTVELSTFGNDLVQRWTGALFSLSPANPDAARHFCTSAREVVVKILDTSAPDDEVKKSDPNCEITKQGAVTRRAKISYLLSRHGVNTEQIADAVNEDVNNLLSLFRTFNDGTHGHAGRFTITELTAIRTRVESAISFLHRVVSEP